MNEQSVYTQRDFSKGLVTSAEAWQLQDSESPNCRNMVAAKRGSIASARGVTRVGAAAPSSILGLFPFERYTYTPAHISGGSSSTTISTWNAVTNGYLKIPIGGTTYTVGPMDFSTVTTNEEAASILQAAIRTATSGNEVVEFVSSYFKVYSDDDTSDSIIDYAIAPSSGTDVSGASGEDYFNIASAGGGNIVPRAYLSSAQLLVRMYGNKAEYTANPFAATPTWADIETFTAAQSEFGAVEYDYKIWYCSGGGSGDDRQFRSFNGLAVAKYSSAPKMSMLEVFRNTCFGAGVEANPETLYFSDVDDFTNWGSGDAGSITIGDPGDRITGLKAISNDTLIVYKLRSLWKVTYKFDEVTSTSYYAAEKISEPRGCVAPRTVAMVNNDAVALSNAGVTTVGTEANYSGLREGTMSDGLKNLFKATDDNGILNESYTDKSSGFFHEGIYYLSVPIEDSMSPNVIYYYDPDYNGWFPLEGIGANIFCAYRTSDLRDRLFFGSSDGGIYYFDDVHNYAGIAFRKEYWTKRNDLGYPGLLKDVKWVRVSGVKSLYSTIACTFTRDYSTEDFEITDNDLVTDRSGGYIGENLYGSTYCNGSGSSDGVPTYRYRKTYMPNEGRLYEVLLALLNENADEPFSIDTIQYGFDLLDFQETLIS